MADYIVELMNSLHGNAKQIFVVAVLVLLITLMYCVVFLYAKKRNLTYFVAIVASAVLILFGLSFLGVNNLQIYVIFVLTISAFAGLLFFAQDFRRDLFRMSWRNLVDSTGIAEELGREDLHKVVNEIVKACQYMSRNDTGALIVICDNISETITDSGTQIDAVVSGDLLETIFFDKTPLHDGAVVIKANKIVAASCYLPLTQNLDLPREFGTRHRAAIGISEANPSLTAIVVSEESGIISAMHDGKIKRYLDADGLKAILECALRLSDSASEKTIWGLTGNDD